MNECIYFRLKPIIIITRPPADRYTAYVYVYIYLDYSMFFPNFYLIVIRSYKSLKGIKCPLNLKFLLN